MAVKYQYNMERKFYNHLWKLKVDLIFLIISSTWIKEKIRLDHTFKIMVLYILNQKEDLINKVDTEVTNKTIIIIIRITTIIKVVIRICNMEGVINFIIINNNKIDLITTTMEINIEIIITTTMVITKTIIKVIIKGGNSKIIKIMVIINKIKENSILKSNFL